MISTHIRECARCNSFTVVNVSLALNRRYMIFQEPKYDFDDIKIPPRPNANICYYRGLRVSDVKVMCYPIKFVPLNDHKNSGICSSVEHGESCFILNCINCQEYVGGFNDISVYMYHAKRLNLPTTSLSSKRLRS